MRKCMQCTNLICFSAIFRKTLFYSFVLPFPKIESKQIHDMLSPPFSIHRIHQTTSKKKKINNNNLPKKKKPAPYVARSFHSLSICYMHSDTTRIENAYDAF